MKLSKDAIEDLEMLMPFLYRWIAILITVFLVTQMLIQSANRSQSVAVPFEFSSNFFHIMASPFGIFFFTGSMLGWSVFIYFLLIEFGRLFNKEI